MKSLLLCILACTAVITCPTVAIANVEAGEIDGWIRSSTDNKGLPSATIILDGTTWGTTTDVSGHFSLSRIPPGRYRIVVRLLGYSDIFDSLQVRDQEVAHVSYEMKESSIPLEEIRITGLKNNGLDDIETSVLDVAPVRAKTLAGVAEDVMRTLQSMPGVLAPNDFTSQLVVRGSGPDQNLILMDNIEIFNPYRLYGIISMFNPETVTDVTLLTGGFPAKYGDRLSAVLDVSNLEGDKSVPLRGSLNASITNANLVLNGRSPFGVDGSFLVSARRTYYDLILGPIAKNSGLVSGDVAFPNFTDIQSKLTFEPWHANKFVLNGIISKDAVDLVSGPDRSRPDSINVKDDTHNDVIGVAWHFFPSTNFLSKFGVSWYRNQGTTGFGGDFLDPSLNREIFENAPDTSGIRLFNVEFDSRYVFKKLSVKEEMHLLFGHHTVETGVTADFISTSLVWHFRPDETLRAILLTRNIPILDEFVQTKRYGRYSFYLQDRVKVGDHWMIQPGMRVVRYGILAKNYVEPRFNISLQLDPLTVLRGAWGIYRQSPGYEKLLDRNNFIDLTNAGVGQLNAERAVHYVLGVERWIDDRWQVRFETYLKDFDNLIVQKLHEGLTFRSSPIPGEDLRSRSGWTDPVAVYGDSITTDPINGATGKSYGVELFLEKRNLGPGDRLSGWISYALARAHMDEYGSRVPFRFDQRHTVNIVLDYKVNAWLNIGIRWKYGSNFPYTPPRGIRPRIVLIEQNGHRTPVIQTDYLGNVIFDIDRGGLADRYSSNLPPYHRLDIRFTASADYWGLDWNFYLDVINVYNRKNILTYQFFIADDLSIGKNETTMLPIIPTLGFSVRF